MNQQQRLTLHYGPYKTPRFKYGSTVMDESRGEVRIVGLSNGRIPWPIGKRAGTKSLVLYRGLARAVRRESDKSIMYWWGVGFKPVTRWRRALGVPHENEGTFRLRQANAQEPAVRRGLQKCWTMPRSLEWRAKIAAGRLGKKQPMHVRQAISKARRGKPLSAEHRRKIRDTHNRRP